jgi:signal recognition particle receptor subunit beta
LDTVLNFLFIISFVALIVLEAFVMVDRRRNIDVNEELKKFLIKMSKSENCKINFFITSDKHEKTTRIDG